MFISVEPLSYISFFLNLLANFNPLRPLEKKSRKQITICSNRSHTVNTCSCSHGITSKTSLQRLLHMQGVVFVRMQYTCQSMFVKLLLDTYQSVQIHSAEPAQNCPAGHLRINTTHSLGFVITFFSHLMFCNH